MRNYNHLYDSEAGLREYLSDLSFENCENILIRVHSAIHSCVEVKGIISIIRDILPCAKIIGCSTSHIILDGKIIKDACLVSVTEFENARIDTGMISCRDAKGDLLSGEELASKLLKRLPERDSNPFMMIFFPLFYSRIEPFVNAINTSKRDIRMLGGTAYLEGETEDNPCYVISGPKATSGDVAYAYINGMETEIHTDYACGVEAVGKKYPIRVDGTKIITVGGAKGGDWYASMLGKAELDKKPSIAEAFPIVKQDGVVVPYHVDYKKDNKTGEYCIETFPELRDGLNISPGYFHPQKTFDQVCAVTHNVSTKPCEAIFGYDCYARNSLLSDCAKWEIGMFSATDISGCLLSGEISCRGKENLYANLSLVVASLADDPGARVKLLEPDVAAVQILQEENVTSLNFLLANAMREMSEELSVQRDMLRDAVFYNPAVGIDNQLKFQYDSESESLDKVAVLYLTNEKMMRLFSGVSETYASLTECYQRIISEYGSYNLHFYSYQETSLMVAANSKIGEPEFEELIDHIQKDLDSCEYEDIKLSFAAVSVVGADDPLSTLELALDYALSHNLKRIHSDDVGSNLEKEQEKLRILWVIREALSHRRVIPYFQEIHSNRPGKPRIFEALMRICDENGKIYYPDTFLPVSKEYALYDRLSELMVSTVMDMFMDKKSRVTINLNVNDIYNRNMLKTIFNQLSACKKPGNYVFEIVESEEITDYEYIKSFASRIHELGGKIAIDDFGSGFSNMLHIMRIDADYIKIDGAIIKEITTDPHVRDFVKFMQNWCDTNDQALICEYIENKEIQDIMEQYGVAYSQGYYFSKPHPWGEDDE